MVPLGIDREKLFIQLDRLEEHLSELTEIQSKVKDNITISALERLIQISIEDCLNIGNHIISGIGLKRADTYREVFTRLREAKVNSKEVGEKMEEFASFRNRLVHLYWEVTERELFVKLKEIDILKKFSKEILKFSEKKGKS